MPGKITIDINRRTASKAGLLWNRLTPTRGAKAVCRDLADRCSTHDLKLDPKDALLGHYARGLDAAGVMEISIEKGTNAREIKKALNLLTDRGFGAAARLLPRHGFQPESPDSALNWADLHRDLATVNYRDAVYFSGAASLVTGFIGFWLGVIIMSELEPKILRLSGALLGAIFPTLFQLFYQPSKHIYRAARFREDCLLLDRLSRGGTLSNFKRLGNIILRMEPENRTTATLNWNFSNLAWLTTEDNEVVKNNPRVIQSIKTAQFSSNADLLATLADNPIAAIRRAAAKNPSMPETILGRLINEDQEPSVRESVRENPVVVAYIKLAEESIDPQELSDLAGKPFPCVRRAAARNSRTPWKAVAWVLSQLQKDPVEGVVREETETIQDSCDTFFYKVIPIYGTVGYRYFSKSIKISEEILGLHHPHRELIMEKLKELNPELHEALAKKIRD